jgi:hypothetical protein
VSKRLSSSLDFRDSNRLVDSDDGGMMLFDLTKGIV